MSVDFTPELMVTAEEINSISQNQIQPTVLDSYIEVVQTAHKAIDIASEILSVALLYVGKGMKFIAVVLTYPVVFIVGGIGMLLWKGAALAAAGMARGIHALDGALNRQPSIN